MDIKTNEAGIEYLARLKRVLADEEHETRKRIEYMSGLDGDAAGVSRREWSGFYQRTAILRAEYEAVVAMLVQLRIGTVTSPVVPLDKLGQR